MYKVHIGCLPSSVTSAQLVAFFQKYGDVKDAKVLKTPKHLASGNAILLCNNQDTHQRIVDIKSFELGGRTIFCEPVLSGAKLKQKNRELTERRLFLSNLPSGMRDQDIAQVMSTFGAVQNAYRIISRDGDQRPFGFVTFIEMASARAACSARKVYFQSTTIYISDYKKANSKAAATDNEIKSDKLVTTSSCMLSDQLSIKQDSRQMRKSITLEQYNRSHPKKETYLRLDQAWMEKPTSKTYFDKKRLRIIESLQDMNNNFRFNIRLTDESPMPIHEN